MKEKTPMLLCLLLVAIVTLLLAPCLGMKWIFPYVSGLDSDIFWQIRLPRVLASFAVGAGLAVCGMVFQAMFRSPLATPFTLGVASGASFGSVLAVLLAGVLPFGLMLPPGVFALLGALGTIMLVYGMAGTRRTFSINTLLLAGVAINYFFASAVAFIQYLSDFTNVFRILHSLMGDLESMGYESLLQLLPFVLPGILLIACMPYELNLIAMGDDIAVSRGVELRRTRKLLFFSTSLTVGGVVSFCGPIGFVGMMAPHICRLLVGSDHRVLMPATLLLGGTLLTICDTLSRTLIAPAEIPVGVLTSLLGCPFFLWLLLKGKSASA
ncbi:MAG: iron transporter permease [Vampirovibrio sp.]|jgi:iron complex transport system permease protein|nr:iron transporter permease [Vampirovibrio sp.]